VVLALPLLFLRIVSNLACLICRYEVKFQNGQECGGAYIKLLSHQDKLDLVNRSLFRVTFLPFLIIRCSVIALSLVLAWRDGISLTGFNDWSLLF